MLHRRHFCILAHSLSHFSYLPSSVVFISSHSPLSYTLTPSSFITLYVQSDSSSHGWGLGGKKCAFPSILNSLYLCLYFMYPFSVFLYPLFPVSVSVSVLCIYSSSLHINSLLCTVPLESVLKISVSFPQLLYISLHFLHFSYHSPYP